MTIWAIYLASGLSAVWAAVHVIMGGREIELPLRQNTGLGDAVRGPAVLVWHYVSGMLVFLSGLFGIGALTDSVALVWAGVVLAAILSIIGLIVPLRLGMRYAVLPQGWLFVPVAILGAFGAI